MENIEEKKFYPRKKLWAFLLSILAPGLGQLYNGEVKKALIFSFGLFAYVICINLFEIKGIFWVYLTSLVLLVVIMVLIVIEATLSAGRKKLYELKSYNKWYVYLFLAILFYFMGRGNERILENTNTRYRILKISSDSGIPNLSIGDYVLGDYNFYDLHKPTYGDLVIFSISDGFSYVYRVIGMPNDTLNIENQLVTYKNKDCNSEFLSNSIYEGYEMEKFFETLPNGCKYQVLRTKTPLFKDDSNGKEVVVPEDSYFLVGDNRNFSFDSRMIGCVKREQIQGKLVSIYFSKDLNKINRNLTSK